MAFAPFKADAVADAVDVARRKRLDKHPAMRRLVRSLITMENGTQKALAKKIGFGESRLCEYTYM